MPTKFLDLADDLEDMRASVERSSGRPTRAASTCLGSGPGCRYRRPGETTYGQVGRLEMYLSQWVSWSCLGVFDDEGAPVERPSQPFRPGWARHFDLLVPPWIQLVYPLKPDEDAQRPSANPHFAAAGLDFDWGKYGQPVYLSDPDVVPEDLRPFVATYPNDYPPGHWRYEEHPGIRFAVSEYVERPAVARDRWHEGQPYETRSGVAASLQPPGWYSGSPIQNLYSMNAWCLADCAPGPCIACHGKSGRRRHLGINRGEDLPMGHICEACLPLFAAQAGDLLAAWVPPAIPKE